MIHGSMPASGGRASTQAARKQSRKPTTVPEKVPRTVGVGPGLEVLLRSAREFTLELRNLFEELCLFGFCILFR